MSGYVILALGCDGLTSSYTAPRLLHGGRALRALLADHLLGGAPEGLALAPPEDGLEELWRLEAPLPLIGPAGRRARGRGRRLQFFPGRHRVPRGPEGGREPDLEGLQIFLDWK